MKMMMVTICWDCKRIYTHCIKVQSTTAHMHVFVAWNDAKENWQKVFDYHLFSHLKYTSRDIVSRTIGMLLIFEYETTEYLNIPIFTGAKIPFWLIIFQVFFISNILFICYCKIILFCIFSSSLQAATCHILFPYFIQIVRHRWMKIL